MQPWIPLAEAPAPDGDMLRLLRRGREYSIRLRGGNELMNSRLGGSEEALARLTLDRLTHLPVPRLLIAGLGMGFTLRAAQALAPPSARLIVAEIVPELVDWAGGPMAEVFGDSLSDPRVQIRIGDMAAMITAGPQAYDAILLDVDNGPHGLTRPVNDALYGPRGLRAAHAALAPGGVLAVWSAAPSDAFTRNLGQAGFATQVHPVRAAHGGGGSRHWIWIAARPA